jgi:hypothetical protein
VSAPNVPDGSQVVAASQGPSYGLIRVFCELKREGICDITHGGSPRDSGVREGAIFPEVRGEVWWRAGPIRVAQTWIPHKSRLWAFRGEQAFEAGSPKLKTKEA